MVVFYSLCILFSFLLFLFCFPLRCVSVLFLFTSKRECLCAMVYAWLHIHSAFLSLSTYGFTSTDCVIAYV